MKLFRKRKPDGFVERRLPENADRRRQHDADQREAMMQTVTSEQQRVTENDLRIARLQGNVRALTRRAARS